MIDSGSAVAETKVARQSRRNSQTTMTARTAPSISSAIEPSKFSMTGSTKLKASVMAVSYTHLDVYKRQESDSGEREMKKNVMLTPLVTLVTGAFEQHG